MWCEDQEILRLCRVQVGIARNQRVGTGFQRQRHE